MPLGTDVSFVTLVRLPQCFRSPVVIPTCARSKLQATSSQRASCPSYVARVCLSEPRRMMPVGRKTVVVVDVRRTERCTRGWS